MGAFLDRVISRLDDDSGAHSIRTFFAQLEYTAYWCIQMLRPSARISAVVPEGFEDVLVVRPDCYEQRQVKTRRESRGPWTVADVLPILAKQYARAHLLDKPSTYHFVSNACADTETTFMRGGFGPLYDLKFLLETAQNDQQLKQDELDTLAKFHDRICPRFVQLVAEHRLTLGAVDPSISVPVFDDARSRAVLNQTRIETDCPNLRFPNHHSEFDLQNVALLSDALQERYPGQTGLPVPSLHDMYLRLIMLVISRINAENTIAARSIDAEQVAACRASVHPANTAEDFSRMPGSTLMEKKARFAGFDTARVQNLHLQHGLAKAFIRKLPRGQATKLEEMRIALVDCQTACREELCRPASNTPEPFGPEVLSTFRPNLSGIASQYFPRRNDVTEQVCLGLIWHETDECRVYWHRIAQGGS